MRTRVEILRDILKECEAQPLAHTRICQVANLNHSKNGELVYKLVKLGMLDVSIPKSRPVYQTSDEGRAWMIEIRRLLKPVEELLA